VAEDGILVRIRAIITVNGRARTIIARKRNPRIRTYLNFRNSIPPLQKNTLLLILYSAMMRAFVYLYFMIVLIDMRSVLAMVLIDFPTFSL